MAVAATKAEAVDLVEEQQEEGTEDLDVLPANSRVSRARTLPSSSSSSRLSLRTDAGGGGMRDGQPPPESAAEKIKKQILKVGDGLVRQLLPLPPFPLLPSR